MKMLKKSTRILGIDPGSALIGYGIIDVMGNNMVCYKQGFYKAEINLPNKEKFEEIYDFIANLIKENEIDEAAIEKLFFFKNAKTAIGVSEMRGVIMLALAKGGLNIREFTPLEVKQAVSTYGRAPKDQVQRMVKTILALDEIPKPDDVADALAIAICCANTTEYI